MAVQYKTSVILTSAENRKYEYVVGCKSNTGNVGENLGISSAKQSRVRRQHNEKLNVLFLTTEFPPGLALDCT